MKLTSDTSLYRVLEQDINRKIICPYCQGEHVIKFGKYSSIQRYKCRNCDCERTFTQKTNSFWAYSKKEFETWKKYINLMFDGATIRSCAEELKINIATSFYWRRKILESLTKVNEVAKLKEYVEMSKIIIKENFKGQKNIDVQERYNINIVSAIDTKKNTLSTPISKGYLSLNMLKNKVYTKICEEAYVISNGDRILNIAASKHNNSLIKAEENENSLGTNFSLMAKRWLSKFNGVATKYLNTYLSWFISISKNNYNEIDRFIMNLHSSKIFKKCREFSKSKLFEGYYY